MNAPLLETGAIGSSAALVIALAIGFAFGWFLERGGLGDARKLAGQFYLSDLTVFKAMFSALVTAMLGAFWLDRFGVLDLDLVYLPETFVVPQAIGGALFGVGFLIGGLCPGTSCVAAASGRLDGLGVIAGMLAGVALFNTAFDRLAAVYDSTALGPMTFTDLLGVPRGLGVGIVTLAALAAFAVAERTWPPKPAAAEADLSGEALAEADRTLGSMKSRFHRMLAIAAAVLGLAAAADVAPRVGPDDLAKEIATERDHISAIDLAERIMRGESLRVIDLRSPGEFAVLHVPGAVRMAIDDLAGASFPRSATLVLYSEGGAHAAQAWMLLRLRGYPHVVFLREGLYEWIARVLEPRLAIDATPAERTAFERVQPLSRFFGGMAHVDVPRAEVPTGYWTASGGSESTGSASTSQMVANIRRRGC